MRSCMIADCLRSDPARATRPRSRTNSHHERDAAKGDSEIDQHDYMRRPDAADPSPATSCGSHGGQSARRSRTEPLIAEPGEGGRHRSRAGGNTCSARVADSDSPSKAITRPTTPHSATRLAEGLDRGRKRCNPSLRNLVTFPSRSTQAGRRSTQWNGTRPVWRSSRLKTTGIDGPGALTSTSPQARRPASSRAEDPQELDRRRPAASRRPARHRRSR